MSPVLTCESGGDWVGDFDCEGIRCDPDDLEILARTNGFLPECDVGTFVDNSCVVQCPNGGARKALRCINTTWVTDLQCTVAAPAVTQSTVGIAAGVVAACVLILLVIVLLLRRQQRHRAVKAPAGPEHSSVFDQMMRQYGAQLSKVEARQAMEGFSRLEIARERIFLDRELGSGRFNLIGHSNWETRCLRLCFACSNGWR